LQGLQLYHPGKTAENPFGYTGQFAVRELLLMTNNLQLELRKPAHEITTASLEKIAVADGMLTMMQDGVLRVIAGDTSLQEVVRVLA
jgi:general secretion pathway protein E